MGTSSSSEDDANKTDRFSETQAGGQQRAGNTENALLHTDSGTATATFTDSTIFVGSTTVNMVQSPSKRKPGPLTEKEISVYRALSCDVTLGLSPLWTAESRCVRWEHMANGRNLSVSSMEIADVAEVTTILNNGTREAAKPAEHRDLEALKFYIVPFTEKVNFYGKSSDKKEYKPTLKHVEEKWGWRFPPEKFFSDSGDGVPRTVAIVGGAGYGKTEMVKKFALDVLEGKYAHLRGIQIVHFMNFRDLPEKKEITPGNFLLGETELSDRGLVEPTMDWIESNQEKFLLVIDGADQYKDKQKKLGKKSPVKRYKGEKNSTDILNSLLSCQLFPNIRILYSSRQHAIRFFEDEVRPQRVIALKGFKTNQVEELVRGFGGENGDAIWNHLTNKSPALLSICSIPMFLVFTVSVLKRHLENPPETLTGVLMYVLNDLVTSEHMQTRDQIYDVLHHLKKVAFEATKDGRVTFTMSDLPPDAQAKEIHDLVITLLGSDARNRRLLEGHWKYIFCHQSLQEALAALYIAEMATSDFEEIIEKEIHEPHWSVVRRLLCGIVVDQSIDSIVRGNADSVSLSRAREIDSKREGLVENLRRRMDKLQKSIEGWEKNDVRTAAEMRALITKGHDDIFTLQSEFLEILHAIHECSDGADEILSSLQRIDIDCLSSLTASDDHVVIDAVRRCPNLDYLRIPLSSGQLLKNLAPALAQRRTKIGTLKVQDRTLLWSSLFDLNFIHDLLPHVKHELELHADFAPRYDIPAIQTVLDSLPPTDLVVKVTEEGLVGKSVTHTLTQGSGRCMAD